MKALIRLTRKTEYASIVEMTAEKYNELQDHLGSPNSTDRKRAEKELNKLIDTADWQGDELDHIDEFNEEKS